MDDFGKLMYLVVIILIIFIGMCLGIMVEKELINTSCANLDKAYTGKYILTCERRK